MGKYFSVVVKAVVMRNNTALCLLRSENEMRESFLNSTDSWDLPGGGLKYYEKLESGLLREIKEETSLEVKIIKPIDAHDVIRHSIHAVFITYLCEYKSGEVVLSGEHRQHKWADKREINDINIQRWLKHLYLKAFDEYAAYKRF